MHSRELRINLIAKPGDVVMQRPTTCTRVIKLPIRRSHRCRRNVWGEINAAKMMMTKLVSVRAAGDVAEEETMTKSRTRMESPVGAIAGPRTPASYAASPLHGPPRLCHQPTGSGRRRLEVQIRAVALTRSRPPRASEDPAPHRQARGTGQHPSHRLPRWTRLGGEAILASRLGTFTRRSRCGRSQVCSWVRPEDGSRAKRHNNGKEVPVPQAATVWSGWSGS